MSDACNITGCKDPVEAILRQDRAFLPGGIDFDLWMSTLSFPMIMMTQTHTAVVQSRDDAIAWLKDSEIKARAEGAVALCTQIRTHLEVSEDEAVISSVRRRISAAGIVVGSNSMTWTVIREGTFWKIRFLLFDETHANGTLTFGAPGKPGDK